MKNNNITIEQIKQLYTEVFDDNFNIKNCGRIKCIELISAVRNYGYNIGNLKTGFINVENAKIAFTNLVKVGD